MERERIRHSEERQSIRVASRDENQHLEQMIVALRTQMEASRTQMEKESAGTNGQ
jgi:hypothetical protein